jgi:hypothetical protein
MNDRIVLTLAYTHPDLGLVDTSFKVFDKTSLNSAYTCVEKRCFGLIGRARWYLRGDFRTDTGRTAAFPLYWSEGPQKRNFRLYSDELSKTDPGSYETLISWAESVQEKGAYCCVFKRDAVKDNQALAWLLDF